MPEEGRPRILTIDVFAGRYYESEPPGCRSWDITVTGLPHGVSPPARLHDPFTREAYKAYETWLRSRADESTRGSAYLSKSLREHPHWWWQRAGNDSTGDGAGGENANNANNSNASNANNELPADRRDTLETEPTGPPSLLQASSVRTYESQVLASTHTVSDDSAMFRLFREPPSIDDYRRELVEALRLDDAACRAYDIIKIYVCEDVNAEDNVAPPFFSIHSLMWELLEPYNKAGDGPAESRTNHSGIGNDGIGNGGNDDEQIQMPPIEVHRLFTRAGAISPLKPGLRIPENPIRLLVVIARGLQVDEENKFVDIRSVVHDTLYSVSKYLHKCGRSDRLHVDVVRPGTLGELDTYLTNRKTYDLVHLDVHGGTEEAENTSQLLFSHPEPLTAPLSRSGRVSFDKQVFHPVDTGDVAALLQRHGVSAVALSACLSSWAQGLGRTNMCRVFAQYGVRIMTGMSFTVWSDKAEAYYAGFYPALILTNCGFRKAAVHGRLSLQRRLIEQQRLESQRQDNGSQRARASKRRPRRQALGPGASQQPSSRSPTGGVPAEQTYPTVTTYVASAFERTNSAALGVDLSYVHDRADDSAGGSAKGGGGRAAGGLADGLANGYASGSSSERAQGGGGGSGQLGPRLPFWLRLLTAAVLLATTACAYVWRALSQSTFGCARLDERALAAFDAYRTSQANQGKVHSVGLMALEGYLQRHGLLYIEMAVRQNLSQPRLLDDIFDSWLWTNFAGHVEIVSAADFHNGALAARLRLRQEWSAWRQKLWLRWLLGKAGGGGDDDTDDEERVNWMTSRNGGWGDMTATRNTVNRHTSLSNKSVLIIDNIESVVGTRGKALDRLDEYISAAQRQARGRLYVVMMGARGVDWTDLRRAGDYKWALAPHLRTQPGLVALYQSVL